MLVYGFKLGKLQQDKQPAVKQAFDDAVALIEKAQGGFQQGHLKKWVGGQADKKDADTAAGQMAAMIGSVNVVVDTASPEGAGANSFAFCNAENFRGNKNPFDDCSKSWTGPAKIFVGPNFFSDKVSRGERAQSLLHEFTHLAFATTDEKFGTGAMNGKECYGADYCVELANSEPTKARRNADNWGFYFAAYRDKLGWSGDDGKYLEPDECAKVRGKRF